MKILVTGVSGQLGHDTVNEALKRGHEVAATDVIPPANCASPFFPMDITDRAFVSAELERVHPDVVIHCAAWTNVDGAEDEENRPKVDRINHIGTRNIAEACAAIGCGMTALSGARRDRFRKSSSR